MGLSCELNPVSRIDLKCPGTVIPRDLRHAGHEVGPQKHGGLTGFWWATSGTGTSPEAASIYGASFTGSHPSMTFHAEATQRYFADEATLFDQAGAKVTMRNGWLNGIS